MTTSKLFRNLNKSNFIRFSRILPNICVAALLMVMFLIFVGLKVSDALYDTESIIKIRVGYHLPDDSDKNMNAFGVSVLTNTESMTDICEVVEVSSKEEGIKMLEKGELDYYIDVPENFFTGIMDSTNPPLNVYIADSSSFLSYITNEVFFCYARYLGTAQAAIYAGLDTSYELELPDEERDRSNIEVNVVLLDRVINKDAYVEKVDASEIGGFSLKEHYIAVAVLLTLFFTAFALSDFYFGYKKGMLLSLEINGLHSLYIFASNLIITFFGVYVSFIIAFIGVSIFNKSINPIGIITVIPVVLIVSLLINIIAALAKNHFTSNMGVFVFAILLLYISGGILPASFLPSIIQKLSFFLHSEWLIDMTANSLF